MSHFVLLIKTRQINHFWHFWRFLSTLKFARNVECNFFCNFQTLCIMNVYFRILSKCLSRKLNFLVSDFLLLQKCLLIFDQFFPIFQTEASLSNLQKSIHPLAMSKLKGLLDLQEEIVNYKSEEEFRGKTVDPDHYHQQRKKNHEF